MLRDGALSDRRVISFVNDKLVPVWIDVRADAYPLIPALHDRDGVMFTTPGGQVLNLYYLSFLARSYVLSPDLRTLLNEADGMLGHADMAGGSYVGMLQRAVARYQPPPVELVGR